METSLILQKDILSETFENMRGLINEATYQFYTEYGGNFKELQAEAHLLFILAYNSHKKSKAKLSTWICFRIKKGLLDYIRNKYKEVPSNVIENKEEELLRYSRTKKNPVFSTMEFLDNLKDDAQVVVNLVWNPPEDIYYANSKKGNHPCHTKLLLKNYLLKLGWTGKRIKESFSEISEVMYAI